MSSNPGATPTWPIASCCWSTTHDLPAERRGGRLWDEGQAYSCLNWRSAGGGILTGPHEIGHNFGCAHDHENDTSAPYSYCWGHSYTLGQETYGTIMSYVGTTLPYFSNPDILGPGAQPLGVPPGEARAAFNALIIRQTRPVLANYRRSTRVQDCNNNGVDDATDIANGASADENRNGIPDEAEIRVFVDADPHTEDDGAGWEGARRDLAEVVEVSNLRCANVREIWVADGTYTPDSGSEDPWRRFSLRSGLALRGGFEGRSRAGGGETDRSQRNIHAHPSVLSGDIGIPNDPTDNAYAVVDAFDTDDTAVLDGFVVSGGNSFGDGGGLYGVRTGVRLLDCTFASNTAAGSGGGIMFYDNSAPMLRRCAFSGNVAGFVGGAIGVNGSILRADSCGYAGNAAASYAGAMDAFASDVTVVNGEFRLNTAGESGGAISTASGAFALADSTVFGNHATGLAGGLVASGSVVRVRNTILWGNTSGDPDPQSDQLYDYSGTTSIDYSIVEGLDGSLGGTGNLGADPLLRDAASGDLSLEAGSPAIDAGSNPLVEADGADLDGDGDTTEAVPLDAADDPRFHNDPGVGDTGISGHGHPEVVDIGSREFQGNSCPADFTGDGTVNTIDVLQFLNAWAAHDGRADFNHDGSVNTIDVLQFLNAWVAGC
ncbi:MAG: hypothetical protein IPJ41_01175 [Phycisphaerales bacterium]|nr:hypothetical protein [Phycisphaerales bacterium]